MPVHAYLVTDRHRYRQERMGGGGARGSGGRTVRARARIGAEDGLEVPVEGFEEVAHTDDVVAGDRTGRAGPVERHLGRLRLRFRPRPGDGAIRCLDHGGYQATGGAASAADSQEPERVAMAKHLDVALLIGGAAYRAGDGGHQLFDLVF